MTPLRAQPLLHLVQQRLALLLPHGEPLSRTPAVDVALDGKQRIDAPDRLQRNRRDRPGVLAAPRIAGDIDQFKELPARMREAESGRDRRLLLRRVEQRIEAVITIGLKEA